MHAVYRVKREEISWKREGFCTYTWYVQDLLTKYHKILHIVGKFQWKKFLEIAAVFMRTSLSHAAVTARRRKQGRWGHTKKSSFLQGFPTGWRGRIYVYNSGRKVERGGRKKKKKKGKPLTQCALITSNGLPQWWVGLVCMWVYFFNQVRAFSPPLRHTSSRWYAYEALVPHTQKEATATAQLLVTLAC